MNTLDRPILICYDRSAGAHHAIEKVADLFPGRMAIVLHVWSPAALMFSTYGGTVAVPAYDDKKLQQAAATVAEEGSRVAAAAGLHASPETAELTLEGTWHTILEAADEHDASLIVLGARGLSTFKSIMLGSVSHSVAQHAHRPVLIVPPDVPTTTGSGGAGRAAGIGLTAPAA